MFAYIVRRLALMLVTLFGISVIIFVLLRIVPGNIVDILFDAAGFVDPADKANLEKELGLNQPIVVQYLQWIGGLLHGDLGYSYVSEKPALQEILPRIPITARLAGLALLFSTSIGIPLGVISAVHQGTRLDYVLRVVSLSGLSLPSFWLGLLILMASVSLFGSMPIFNPNPRTWTEAFAIYCVPAMAVGFRSAALTMRITRSSMLEVLRQDYIRTARAKGASEASVNYRHALKNAILPVITVIGIEAAFLIGGLIVTETVFNIPGVARFLVEALRWRDYPIVQNLVMLIAVVVVVRELHRRHALCRDRSAHPLHGLGDISLAVVNYDSELKRAGADATHGWRRLTFLAQRYMLGTVGLIIMVLFVWVAISANLISRFDPLSVDSAHRLSPPDWRHWMGTDSFGRDVWSRIIHGARISLAVGIGSTALGSSLGVIIGLASGYLSGWVDLVFQRVTDILQALPLLVLALVMTAALGPSLPNVIIAIAIPLIPTVARVIRANTLALRELPFVEAAKSIGMSETRIALRHVLPNTMAPLIVLATAQLGSTILTEASLSFLGLGIPEPYPSWGRMLSESAAEYVRVAPWLVIFPGVAISLAVFGTNLFGDALRDILDPRQRG